MALPVIEFLRNNINDFKVDNDILFFRKEIVGKLEDD